MMTASRLFNPWPALVILFCAALPASPAAAANWKFRPDDRAQIEVNGEAQADAKLLVTDTPGVYLVELPFDSKYVLVNTRSRSAILLMRNEVKRARSDSRGDAILIDQSSALSASSYALHSEGQTFDFQTDIASVRVYLPAPKSGTEGEGTTKTEVASARPDPETPTAGPTTAAAPPSAPAPTVTESDAARACVRLETMPSTFIPDCMKSVYAINSCDKPVIALVAQTQHLMSGRLSDALTVEAPPHGRSWVSCAWWSGAMAPATLNLIRAGFVEPPPQYEHGGHHGDRQSP